MKLIYSQFEHNSITGQSSYVRRVKYQRWATNDDCVNLPINSGWGRGRRIRIRSISSSPDWRSKSDGLGDSSTSRHRWDRISSIGGRCPGCRRASGSSRRKAGTDSKSGILEVGEGIRSTIGSTIDSKDHSLATMASRGSSTLTTVYPDRLSLNHGQFDMYND